MSPELVHPVRVERESTGIVVCRCSACDSHEPLTMWNLRVALEQLNAYLSKHRHGWDGARP